MKILALELSTSRGSLAWLDGEIEFTREWPNDRKNSAAFFENLQAVRRKFGAPETIIVGLGPGRMPERASRFLPRSEYNFLVRRA
jgi:hypothetical protein